MALIGRPSLTLASILALSAVRCADGEVALDAGHSRDARAATDVSTSRDVAAVDVTTVLDAGAPDAAAPDVVGGPDVASVVDTPSVPGVDQAAVRSATMPGLLACAGAVAMTIVMANTGTTTWTAGDYALAAVGGTDPLATTPRLALATAVPPGGMASFTIAGTAPPTGGAYVSDWRMARGATLFGATAARAVAVNCPGVDSIDLGAAQIHTSPPGAPGWPVTAQITALDIAPAGGVGNGGIIPEFTRKDGPMRWPDVRFLGGTETIYYTVWLVLNIGGRWHAAGAQQYWYDNTLRMCGIPSGWTTNLLYDVGRWGAMTRYPIAPGEIIGVFVASGDHRSRTDTAGSTVLERSAVVLFPFPGDTTVTYRF